MSDLFAIICRDKPGSKETRMEKLEEHIAHIDTVLDRLAVASPLRDENEEFTGALLVVKADSKADAQALIERDPYYKAGIWSSVEVHVFGPAAGEWIGEKQW